MQYAFQLNFKQADKNDKDMINIFKNQLFILTAIACIICSCRPEKNIPRAQLVLSGELLLNLPARDSAAISGTAFIKSIDTVSFENREKRVVKEILSGNIPRMLRKFKSIEYIATGTPDSLPHTVQFYVLPDYLAVGSDEDFVRMPMGPLAAQQIADSLYCSMPTALLVDKIAQASVGAIDPFPFRPLGHRNEQPIVFEDSNHAINALFKAKGYYPGQLISGLKKDVIISARIADDTTRSNHVTIYGWHEPNGKRIQPANNVHTNYYVDYSHGIRLISRTIKIDGKEYDMQQVLRDPAMYMLLSNESTPMQRPTYAGDVLHR